MPQLPRANPVNIPIKPLPKPTMRNSVEGLNQEIERLVLNPGKSETFYSDKIEDHKVIIIINFFLRTLQYDPVLVLPSNTRRS